MSAIPNLAWILLFGGMGWALVILAGGRPRKIIEPEVATHLNAALRACYANAGPSPIVVEIRQAMGALGVKEDAGTGR